MKVMVMSGAEMIGFMQRMSGRTAADDLRTNLAACEVSMHLAQKALLDTKSHLYGQTFWMVVSAEALLQAEAKANEIRAELDAIGDKHRGWREEDTLRRHGILPPFTIADAVAQCERAFGKQSS